MNKSGRNYWNEFKKNGELLVVSPEDKNQDSATDTWNVIYESMSPFEKGTFNARQRKEKEIAKTSGDIGPTFFQDKLPKKKKTVSMLEYIDTMQKRYNDK